MEHQPSKEQNIICDFWGGATRKECGVAWGWAVGVGICFLWIWPGEIFEKEKKSSEGGGGSSAGCLALGGQCGQGAEASIQKTRHPCMIGGVGDEGATMEHQPSKEKASFVNSLL